MPLTQRNETEEVVGKNKRNTNKEPNQFMRCVRCVHLQCAKENQKKKVSLQAKGVCVMYQCNGVDVWKSDVWKLYTQPDAIQQQI